MMAAKLQALGAMIKYTEYADMDHYITWKVYGEPDLLPWLFRQNRLRTNGVHIPRGKIERGGAVFSAVRKNDCIELRWQSAAVPDAVELYTLNGRMLRRRQVDGGAEGPISLRLPFGQGALFIKIIKKGVTLHAQLFSSK
jgi:hypothetical protein